MTRTRFCDSAGLAVLARAHHRAITTLDRIIPLFRDLDEALASGPGAVIRTLRPCTLADPRLARRPGNPGNPGIQA